MCLRFLYFIHPFISVHFISVSPELGILFHHSIFPACFIDTLLLTKFTFPRFLNFFSLSFYNILFERKKKEKVKWMKFISFQIKTNMTIVSNFSLSSSSDGIYSREDLVNQISWLVEAVKWSYTDCRKFELFQQISMRHMNECKTNEKSAD